ncbi:hypothetical protein SDC9_157726 [bioreactor metagenome]|uniref:Uncharacterized protein n=1 Tax=bioreactor metagenome TaxID=1076179 RepID=A0A645F805_9ZZZZ
MQLHFLVAAEVDPLIVVIDRHREGDLRLILSDHILVQNALDLLGRGQLIRNLLQAGGAGVLEPVVQNTHTQLNALVADTYARPLNHPVDLLLVLAAEGTAKGSLGVFIHGITSVLSFRCLSEIGAISDSK